MSYYHQKTRPFWLHVLFGMFLTGLLTVFAGCSETDELAGGKDGKLPATVQPYTTNATRAKNAVFQSFSLFSYDEWFEYINEYVAYGVYFSKDEETGKWSSDIDYYMSDFTQDAWGISPHVDAVQNPTFTLERRSFDYTLPDHDQVMIWVGMKEGFTYESENNVLKMRFDAALFEWQTLAMATLDALGEDLTVNIKSITLHNLPDKGRFTFDYKENADRYGDWERLGDGYVNLTQVNANAYAINNTDFLRVLDSTFVVIPLGVPENVWVPGTTIEYANNNHQFYFEITCQITMEKDGRTVYLWGSEDGAGNYPQYETVYVPYDPYMELSEWSILSNTASTYFMMFEPYNSGGELIKPHSESGVSEFTISKPVDFLIPDGNVDGWTDDTANSVEILL